MICSNHWKIKLRCYCDSNSQFFEFFRMHSCHFLRYWALRNVVSYFYWNLLISLQKLVTWHFLWDYKVCMCQTSRYDLKSSYIQLEQAKFLNYLFEFNLTKVNFAIYYFLVHFTPFYCYSFLQSINFSFSFAFNWYSNFFWTYWYNWGLSKDLDCFFYHLLLLKFYAK